jgi:uncharacterized membrane protein (UPF0127 family)
VKALNSRNGETLADDVELAVRVMERMKGLLGRKQFSSGKSLWIKPCKSIHTIGMRFIHTIGMRFPIDVLFLDKKNIIVKIKKNFLPNRISGLFLNAVSVLELPSGILTATDTRAGDRIKFV